MSNQYNFSLNANVQPLVNRLCKDAEKLGAHVLHTSDGTKIIDVGVKYPGSVEAAILYAEICMGGLGKVQYLTNQICGLNCDWIKVNTLFPGLVVAASQAAGWIIKGPNGERMIGCGPARSLAQKDNDRFLKGAFYEEPLKETSVLCLQTNTIPSESICQEIANTCGLGPASLQLVCAASNSIVGSVQVASRVVEEAVHRLNAFGIPCESIIWGYGTAPVAPVASTEIEAMYRINECGRYGGTAHVAVDWDVETLKAIAPLICSKSGPYYGKSFKEIFIESDFDFSRVDVAVFSPAEIYIYCLRDGSILHHGSVDLDKVNKYVLAGGDGFGMA